MRIRKVKYFAWGHLVSGRFQSVHSHSQRSPWRMQSTGGHSSKILFYCSPIYEYRVQSESFLKEMVALYGKLGLYLKLARLRGLRAQFLRVPSLLTPTVCSGLIVYQKDSQNSLNAIILMVAVYHQQSTQNKTDWKKRCIGQSLGEFQKQCFVVL